MGKWQKAIDALDAINSDPEIAHYEAEEILLKAVPPEVREAYQNVRNRTGAWWYA